MKKSWNIFFSALTLSFSVGASTLESELKSLEVPANKGAISTAEDKLYAIQTRFAPLAKRHEFAFSLGKNFNQDGHMDTNQFGGMYRFHFSDKWAMGLNYFRMNNELSPSGQKLLNDKKIIPDRDYVVQQTDAIVEYNLFYGKLRFNMDQVTYFDQYIGLGAGQVTLGGGSATAVVFDAGFAFWLGKNGSARLGVKNDFYKEQNANGSTNVHNMVGYLAFGYLLGGEG